MRRPIRLLVNPSSGGGRSLAVLPAVEAELARLGLEHRTEVTRDLGHARELARTAAEDGATVVTLSGDGLIGCVVGVLRSVPDAVLGVLPGGRGNDFARVLGLPRDPVHACSVIAAGDTRTIDVGDADGRAFIGIASAGFDSEANRIANEAPSWLGQGVYAYGALRALAAWRPARFELELDGARRTFSGYTVAAANSRAYGGGMFLAPDAELDDGMLDVVISSHVPRRTFLAALPDVFKGRHVLRPSVQVLRARELRISADRPFTLYADGDPIAELPTVVRALPGAVRVIAPAGAPLAGPGAWSP